MQYSKGIKLGKFVNKCSVNTRGVTKKVLASIVSHVTRVIVRGSIEKYTIKRLQNNLPYPKTMTQNNQLSNQKNR